MGNTLKQHALPITTAFVQSVEHYLWLGGGLPPRATYFWVQYCLPEWLRFRTFDPKAAGGLEPSIDWFCSVFSENKGFIPPDLEMRRNVSDLELSYVELSYAKLRIEDE